MEKSRFYRKKKCKKVDFFSCDFKIFDGTIGCATKFHANEIYFFFYLLRSKVIAFFCEKFAKVEHTICDCNWPGQDIQTN